MRRLHGFCQSLFVLVLIGIVPTLCRIACALPQEQAASRSCCDENQPKSKACSQECCSSFTASSTQSIVIASLETSAKLLPNFLHFVLTDQQVAKVSNILPSHEPPIFSLQLDSALPLGANAPPAALKA